ncbi:MAG: alpha-D-ribose 1-methylphosphonate 5-triphosphate synthase subunit PhnL [Candidatus Endobugula sp.]|jgi:alpha-D-ribose 1-methylphosphonate 5-triphosphate synthase subunit PhnL
MPTTRLVVSNLKKDFILHTQHNAHIPVFNGFSLSVDSGECAVLLGPSGMGKSTFLKCLYGNYKITSGSITLYFDDGEIDVAKCEPEWIHGLRRQTIGYVSQFLRVIPRVAAIDVVVEPLLMQGVTKEDAYQKAAVLLARLHIPEKLWSLSPTTFSGGEQQRVNIARGFIANYPVLLLDEPTASLDAKNRAVVIELINEAKANGAAVVGIFHDKDVRDTVADNVIDLSQFVA